jgi:MraZ protein
MLLGTYPAKFASGHRISIPSQFRKELGENYILARWYEGCLVLVGKEYWNALYKRLTGSTEIIVNPIRDTERFILASAYEVFPDEQGRIVIPERLASYSGLSEDIYFIGLGEKAEIWDKLAWEAKEKEVVKGAANYIEQLAKNDTTKHRSNEEEVK